MVYGHQKLLLMLLLFSDLLTADLPATLLTVVLSVHRVVAVQADRPTCPARAGHQGGLQEDSLAGGQVLGSQHHPARVRRVMVDRCGQENTHTFY